jgi:hypothetical protein
MDSGKSFTISPIVSSVIFFTILAKNNPGVQTGAALA